MAWGSVAHAQTGTVTVMGMGTSSCGRFIAAIGKHAPGEYQSLKRADGELVSENAEYQQWLLGFVSGINVARASDEQQQRIMDRIDMAGIDLWLRNWCNKNPTKEVIDGAVALLAELRNNAVWGQR
jgi:hypothetical protein